MIEDVKNVKKIKNKWWNIRAGCLFPREPMNFVRRKSSNSQEILRNMNKPNKLFDIANSVVPRQNNDSRESENGQPWKIGIAKIIHKIA